MPSLINSVFVEVVKGLQETLKAQGYQILLGNTDYDLDREYQLVRTFLGWSCSALVTAGLRHNNACRTLLANWGHPIMEVMELGKGIDLNVGLDHCSLPAGAWPAILSTEATSELCMLARGSPTIIARRCAT